MTGWVTPCTGWLAGLFLPGGSEVARPAFYEYVLVAFSVVVLVWVFYLAIRATVRPGEERKEHIKRLVLEDRESEPNE